MMSDVPADGYSVELGQMEPPESRGQILVTGQRIRFSFCILAGFLQTFFVNGSSTNAPDCPIEFENCWAWGLSINAYYGLLFVLILILTIPIIYLKETDPSNIPQHSFNHFIQEIWITLQNQTTLFLLIFVIGTGSLTNFVSTVNTYLQYKVIGLTNFEAGIDTMTTYMALVFAIWLFQKYLIQKNWRYTQYGSTIFAGILGLMWIPAYYDYGGCRNAW
jgi:Na+/melibiose symporter-like transporter